MMNSSHNTLLRSKSLRSKKYALLFPLAQYSMLISQIIFLLATIGLFSVSFLFDGFTTRSVFYSCYKNNYFIFSYTFFYVKQCVFSCMSITYIVVYAYFS